MLAGCSSSSLLSPRHRLRNESSSHSQFQACHFHSMSTQRLDLPCTTFSRNENSRSQQIRPVNLSIENPIEPKPRTCSLKHSVRLPPLSTTRSSQTRKDHILKNSKKLKRFAEEGSVDENRAKRKKGSLGSEEFLLQSGFNFTGHDHDHDHHHQGQYSVSPFTGIDENRVCYVSSEVISPPLPWFDSVITKTPKLDERETGISYRPGNDDSSSSNSSESNGVLDSKLLKRKTELVEVGNSSRIPYYPQEVFGEEDNQEEHHGFELISLLTAVLEAIRSKNIGLINHFIAKLGHLASPVGNCPVKRVIAYYTEALALRVSRIWPNLFQITPPRDFDRRLDDDSGSALRFLNQITPIPKFIHFTANEILLRSFEGKDRIHIIDFDIKQGLQWPSLFQSLASRINPPTHVRVTGIGESKKELNETGDRLARFAEALNLQFEFHPVIDRLEDVRLWMLHVKEGEDVAVNCIFQLHKTLYDSNGGAMKDLLGLIRSTNPTIVVVAEQETEHNSPVLENRVCNSLKYYSAIFDSIDSSSLPLENPMRVKIEEMFGREIRNIVACEGSERIERHEGFEKWREIMRNGGFSGVGITEREMIQCRMLLKMFSLDEYRVEKKQGKDGGEDEGITLCWIDQPLYTVSAWEAIDDVIAAT